MGDLFFCGDTHGEFQHVIDAVKLHRPVAIIFLGDLQAKRPLEVELEEITDLTEVWFIHGNHDTDSDADYDHLFSSNLANRNLHGRVVEIGGYRIAGLGGVFRGQVWIPPTDPKFDSQEDYAHHGGKGNLWRGGLTRKHRSTIFPIDYASLASQKADILVTHEAPSCHPHGFPTIDQLARSMDVGWSFHGHHHDDYDYKKAWKSLGFNAYGVGLCSIARFDSIATFILSARK
ncbi:metallophosphoesterase family protein [Undibacterium sp. Di24W]|uniref:metallophosphoesterase family protein n=1 Tax=Undibacterium sp. Di24W TaxID=3413033 RepID=UPI003BF287A8